MILHLVTRHHVSNSCLSVFENRLPGQNVILVLGSLKNSASLPEVKNSIEVSEENEKSVVESLDFSIISHVVIHYLTPNNASFVQKYVPEGIPLYWWTYGWDLYGQFLERRGYDLFYTDLTPFKPGWPYMVYRFLETYKNRLNFRLGRLKGDKYMQTEFLDRIDGIIPCIPPDYEVACKYLHKNYKIVRVHPVGNPPFDEEFHDGNVIAIGHSASFTDNHLYALKYLSKIDIKDSVISLTLSYNINSYRYLNAVKDRFKNKYKEKVRFIENILSKEDFFKSQNNLKILIIPSWRQEALSNIGSCLLRGVKIFLSKKGPMYKYFLDYGYKVYAIEDITQNEVDTPLTYEEKLHNRKLRLHHVQERRKLIDEDFKLYFGESLVDNN